jgi:hypothetical protein
MLPLFNAGKTGKEYSPKPTSNQDLPETQTNLDMATTPAKMASTATTANCKDTGKKNTVGESVKTNPAKTSQARSCLSA